MIGTCPKCQATRSDGAECPNCGIIYSKFEAAREKLAAAEANRIAARQASQAKEEAAISANLLPCNTCRVPIAKSATTCPHCGAKKKNSVSKAGLVVAGLFTVAMIVGIANEPPRESIENKASKLLQEHPDQAHKIAARQFCDQTLNAHLKDPDSLKIDAAEQLYEAPSQNIPATVYTYYEIRAKNSFGGYVRSSYICTTKITDNKIALISFKESGK